MSQKGKSPLELKVLERQKFQKGKGPNSFQGVQNGKCPKTANVPEWQTSQNGKGPKKAKVSVRFKNGKRVRMAKGEKGNCHKWQQG